MDIKDFMGRITVNTQSSIRIESTCGTVYLDPLEIAGEPHDADLILVTHDHYDHFSPDDIKKIAKPESVLVFPKKMEDKAADVKALVGKTEAVEPGASLSVNGIEVKTIPAYNNLKPFHPKKAGWVGYLLTVDGQTVYVAGDTDVTQENRTVSCDIAMVPIGGTYTMDAKKAAALINEIKPKAVIPTHYGTIVGKPSDVDVFAPLVDPEIPVERKLTF